MSDNDKPGLSYRQAGVDIDAGNDLVERIKPHVKRTLRPEVLAGLGGFGGLFALGGRFQDPVLVSGTDGVGTKLLLARRLDRHDTIGIDLVAMCVNDILVQAAEPLFFLDYFACGKLDVDQAEAVIRGIAEGCHRAGCALIGGETAEMPGMYAPGDYDLAGFAVGAVERQRLVDGRRIRPGCRLLGLASSGPHSNGYSLIRRVLEISGESPGRAFGETTLGETLLAPTRIYAEPVRRILAAHLPAGMAHITGGGLTDNIIRVVPDDYGIVINSGAWHVPEIFGWLQRTGNVADAEMRRTFNLGVGYVIIVESDAVAAVRDAIDEPLLDIGEVTAIQPGGERVHFIDP